MAKYNIQCKDKVWELYEKGSDQILAKSGKREDLVPLYNALQRGLGFGQCGFTPGFMLIRTKDILAKLEKET